MRTTFKWCEFLCLCMRFGEGGTSERNTCRERGKGVRRNVPGHDKVVEGMCVCAHAVD